MVLYVISGAPSTGKTTLLEELKKRGYNILPEAARTVGEAHKELRGKEFQEAILKFQKEQLAKSEKGIFFVDRGFGDTLSYYLLQNLPIPKKEMDYVMKTKYSGVFILDFLDFYEQEGRVITKEKQKEIQSKLIETYKKLNYNPILIPFATITERADIILSKI